MLANDVRLERRMMVRGPSRAFRFWFSAEHELLVLDYADAEGFGDLLKSLGAERGGVEGGALVDANRKVVFFGPGLGAGFLDDLAAYVSKRGSAIPALAGLIDAQAADLGVDAPMRTTIQNTQLADLTLCSAPHVWKGVLQPSLAAVGELLASRRPGEKLWFYAAPDAESEGPILLVLPVEKDPDVDLLSHQSTAIDPDGLQSIWGHITPLDDGRLELATHDPCGTLLPALGAWVRRHANEHPALLRLVDCQLATLDGRHASKVLTADHVWEGLERPPAPGTAAETRAVLDSLQPGEDAWFWLSAHGAFLSMSRRDEDPNAQEFTRRRAGLQQRFGAGIDGVVRRNRSGSVLFVMQETKEDWHQGLRRVLDCHPALSGLSTSKCIQLAPGGIARALVFASPPSA